MTMFQKLVAIEPVSLIPSAEQELSRYAQQVELFTDIPADDDEIVRRIGDADAVLLSYTSRIGREVIERCPKIRYIGMCCSLYSEQSANVDIAFAREKGIRVLGLTGKTGGVLRELADLALVMPETETYRIQELHLPVYHWLCARVEEEFYKE